jgi:hypothetical protein
LFFEKEFAINAFVNKNRNESVDFETDHDLKSLSPRLVQLMLEKLERHKKASSQLYLSLKTSSSFYPINSQKKSLKSKLNAESSSSEDESLKF